MIRGFRDDTEAVGGPWSEWAEAWSWVQDQGLEADRLRDEGTYREDLALHGRTCLLIGNYGSAVLFDPARHPPDEEGRIAW